MKRASGLTIWLTGLSSAGKSTLASAIAEQLCAQGLKAEVLDGDAIRQHLCRDLGFSKRDRDENIFRIGIVAELLTKHGVIVLVAAVSPYRSARDDVRKRIGRFVEVYVNSPLEICERRDMHGIYRRGRAGEIANVTGLDDPYEPPLRPEVECRTDRETPDESKAKIMSVVERWLGAETSPASGTLQVIDVIADAP